MSQPIGARLYIGDDPARVVWHPMPHGGRALWCWDGTRWLDPIAELEDQIAQLVTPHLEEMFVNGFRAGWHSRNNCHDIGVDNLPTISNDENNQSREVGNP